MARSKTKVTHGKRPTVEQIKAIWDVLAQKGQATPTNVANALVANGFQVDRSTVSRVARTEKFPTTAAAAATDSVGEVPPEQIMRAQAKAFIAELDEISQDALAEVCVKTQRIAIAAVHKALAENPQMAIAMPEKIGSMLTSLAGALKISEETAEIAYSMRIRENQKSGNPGEAEITTPNGDRFAMAEAAMSKSLRTNGNGHGHP